MRFVAALPLVLPAALVACSPQGAPGNGSVAINAAATPTKGIANRAGAAPATEVPSPAATPGPATTLAPLDPPAPGTPGGLPDDRTPISEAPFAPDSAQGAANVVQTYYALLGERKYRQAWALWDHDGRDSGMTAAAFAASFAGYSEYHANVGAPGAVDAGMSQRWVTVPVQVYGRLKSGTPVYMLGSVTLHRIVAGAGGPPSQRNWHLRTADIKPRPAG